MSTAVLLCELQLRLRFEMFNNLLKPEVYTVIPRLTKIIRSGITFASRNLR